MSEKIKVRMWVWVNLDHSKKLPAWFIDRQEAEITFEQIKELYDTGYNVMMKHGDDTHPMLLAVDYRAFTSR